MDIPQWYIDDLLIKLVKELSCPRLPMSCDDLCKWAWDVKDSRERFLVRVKDQIFQVEISTGDDILLHWKDTDDPEEVIQAAKEFKSKYL